MERKGKKGKVLALALCGIAVLGIAGALLFRSGKDMNKEYITQIDHALTSEDFLKADGKLLRNARGEQIQLRGTNIGGYLLREFWMSPVTKTLEVRDEITIYRMLEERFGTEKMYELVSAWRDGFFTEADFDNLDALGANCIRLPFWYRNLVDENGEFYENAFARLDWFVEQAGKRGMYVILDMHGAPGSQNGKDISGVDGESHQEETTYFFFGEDAPKYQEQYLKIWTEVASHFAGNPTVAGYDLLNEPFCEYRYTTSRSANELHKLLWDVYDRAYDAIRAVDPDHLVIFEAVWDPSDLPDPKTMGWENIMYEYHNYNYGDYDNLTGEQIKSMQRKLALIRQANYDVPSYMGEFSYFDSLDAWDEGLKLLNEEGIHWTTWTYKTIYGTGNWGLYHHVSDLGKINFNRATEEEILAFCARLGECDPNEGLLEVVGNYMKE